MPFELPRSLSPSKVTTFRQCALAFRFTAIERLPEPPTIWTVKGTLVHSALERLFWRHPQGERSLGAALAELESAWDDLQVDPEWIELELPPGDVDGFRGDAEDLVKNYFRLEDPNDVNPIGIEVTLEARLGDLRLRGIIDRLDLTPEGELIVVDYKTGRAPSVAFEQSKLVGVNIYALLCSEVLGRRPVEVRLLHLKEPTAIIARPSEQAISGQRQKALAVWTAVERACVSEDFRPQTSPLCKFCRFQEFCPAFGGNPADAAPAMAALVAQGAA
ncbi:MAG TPA: PD-(D/E)XK nuclease family protein [Acidimicrobiales bacterium]|jgi:putative RecB family exonuclease|nr:PD-(D/E)XK nuclease family protein [Acidimicrobiales bacterium]